MNNDARGALCGRELLHFAESFRDDFFDSKLGVRLYVRLSEKIISRSALSSAYTLGSPSLGSGDESSRSPCSLHRGAAERVEGTEATELRRFRDEPASHASGCGTRGTAAKLCGATQRAWEPRLARFRSAGAFRKPFKWPGTLVGLPGSLSLVSLLLVAFVCLSVNALTSSPRFICPLLRYSRVHWRSTVVPPSCLRKCANG